MKFSTAVIIIFLALIQTACNTITLSNEDKEMLAIMRNGYKQAYEESANLITEEQRKYVFLQDIMLEDPKIVAKKAGDRGQFILVNLSDNKAQPAVYPLTCSNKVPNFYIDTSLGCEGPNLTYIKLIAQYNLALFNHPNFPYKNDCKIDKALIKEVNAYNYRY